MSCVATCEKREETFADAEPSTGPGTKTEEELGYYLLVLRWIMIKSFFFYFESKPMFECCKCIRWFHDIAPTLQHTG